MKDNLTLIYFNYLNENHDMVIIPYITQHALHQGNIEHNVIESFFVWNSLFDIAQ